MPPGQVGAADAKPGTESEQRQGQVQGQRAVSRARQGLGCLLVQWARSTVEKAGVAPLSPHTRARRSVSLVKIQN